MKAAVYSGTRNLYEVMIPAVKSLLMHSDVDKVFLLIEDDEFPVKLPKEVECINVSGQTWFKPGGANMEKDYFTYMAYIRAALPKIFPELDTILSFDVDTIVDQDVSDLWDIDVSDAYFSACREVKKSKGDYVYYNTGICLYNLKKIREDRIDDKVIELVNTKAMDCPEQDALSDLCQGKVVEMNPSYNCTKFTIPTDDAKIIHYAANKKWFDQPEVLEYSKYTFEEVEKIRKSKKFPKTKKSRLSVDYMIHACSQRMWYVNEYLIPSMLEQGISKESIIVWEDKDGKGNLESFMQSMKWVGENRCYLGGMWHLQDDVVIGSKFAEVTKGRRDTVTCGFCNMHFDGGSVNMVGLVIPHNMWLSFQCIYIPNGYANECAKWYYEDVIPNKKYGWLTKDGKNDDAVFRQFMVEKHIHDRPNNLIENLVDHVDYLLGGSIVNEQREGTRRAFRFRENNIVTELEKKLANRQK